MVCSPRTLTLHEWAPVSQVRMPITEVQRSLVPSIDVHNHLGRWLRSPDGSWMIRDVKALLDVMDVHNVAAIVNLDGRWGAELRENLERYDEAYPGRFVTFCHVDWRLLVDPGGTAGTDALVRSLTRSAHDGARGLKVWKDLGLHLRTNDDRHLLIDDPAVAPVFEAAAGLNMPVMVHTADPVAFFAPVDRYNERLEELCAEPQLWCGGPGIPSFSRLMDGWETVVDRHPETVFIGAHVGCNAEDLGWVDRMLSTYANFNIDLAGRLAELGRQPRATRRLVQRHPDRVLFGSDCYPVDAEGFKDCFRFLETDDECYDYAPWAAVPPNGRWQISAAHLPPRLLSDVYMGNARRLLRL